ncbi:MAG: DUF2182 domain-containing protein [Alphaproteobacteria bacterium]|nr:DUF2182 domain-containing protein [Alphaproteobacteria bacterium]
MRLRLIVAAATAPPWPLLLVASLLGWVGVIGSAERFFIPAYCKASANHWDAQAWRDIETVLTLNPPAGLAAHWLVMLLAMMPLLVAEPVAHLWRRSLARRRMRAVGAFVAAYLALWILLGLPLMLGAVALRAWVAAELPLASLALGFALLWQLTPAKQICLNRCHRLPRLAAFGLAADRDCLAYGLTTAIWCIGACWGLMLLPLVVDRMHLAVMAAVSIVLIAERQRPARPARWPRIRLPDAYFFPV